MSNWTTEPSRRWDGSAHVNQWSIWCDGMRVARVQCAGGSAEENAKLIVDAVAFYRSNFKPQLPPSPLAVALENLLGKIE